MIFFTKVNANMQNNPSVKNWLSKVTPTTFWLKCVNLPKCTKSCFTCKLEVADKNFDLLTKKIISCIGKYGGLKDNISGNIWGVYSNL